MPRTKYRGKTFTGNETYPTGKHRGQPMRQIPSKDLSRMCDWYCTAQNYSTLVVFAPEHRLCCRELKRRGEWRARYNEAR